MPVSIERYTETLLWYENPSFAEYTAVERNTRCGTINLSPKGSRKVSRGDGMIKVFYRFQRRQAGYP